MCVLLLLVLTIDALWGALIYLFIFPTLRLTFIRKHKKGIKLVRNGNADDAIACFQASYDFFSKYRILNNYICPLLSASKTTYKEMALLNTAYCYIMKKDGKKAKEIYEYVLSIYPNSMIAKNAMNTIDVFSNIGSGTDTGVGKAAISEQEPFNGKVVLKEYNPDWPAIYEREAERIRNVLGSSVLQMHHVGSTAVPGMCAKPIIDILLVVSDSSEESLYVNDLEAAGYILRIREPDWFEHRLFKGPDNDINLHIFSDKASEIERMIVFRDWLRNHDDDRYLYEMFKRELSQRVWQQVQDYADAKTTVIQEILDRALKG